MTSSEVCFLEIIFKGPGVTNVEVGEKSEHSSKRNEKERMWGWIWDKGCKKEQLERENEMIIRQVTLKEAVKNLSRQGERINKWQKDVRKAFFSKEKKGYGTSVLVISHVSNKDMRLQSIW